MRLSAGDLILGLDKDGLIQHYLRALTQHFLITFMS